MEVAVVEGGTGRDSTLVVELASGRRTVGGGASASEEKRGMRG